MGEIIGKGALALLPIIWLIVALTGLKMAGHKACVGALIITIVESLFIWKMPVVDCGTSALEGFASALWPIILVIIAAIFTYNLSLKTGAMDVIKQMLTGVSADKRVLVLLIGWCFGGFMEGMAGFGTAIAIPASMLAGMAIAVPKPAMPSIKPPKHHPMRSTSTRLSAETPVSICLMTSMAPVFRDRLYVKMAAMMTRMMGHSAEANPSSAEVPQSTTGIFQMNRDSTMVMISAPTQALCPAILSPVSATMSQMMGKSAKAPFPMISPTRCHSSRLYWCYQFIGNFVSLLVAL